MVAALDLEGRRFGNLSVVFRLGSDSYGQARWLCVCSSCGTRVSVVSSHLTNGHTKSCGCLRQAFVDHFFFSCPSMRSSYWAGFLAADGCIREGRRVSVTTAFDKTHLEKFASDIKFSGRITSSYPLLRSGRRSIAHLLEFTSDRAVQDLEEIYCITPRKSLTLMPPRIRREDLAFAFIIGYIDGDGCICVDPSSGTIELSLLGTLAFLDWARGWLETWAPSMSGGSSVCLFRNRTYRYRMYGQRVTSIGKLLSSTGLEPLERKWHKVFEIL